MTMMRMVVPALVSSLGDDEVEVIVSTSALARDGHILLPQGCQVENYRKNPIWLWSHNTDVPTGNAEDIVIGPDAIKCKVRFAPRGISPRADEVNGLVKVGVIRAVSIGFDPLELEPLDPNKPRAGQRITKWEWLEASWVSVPSDTKAVVTARANGDNTMADILENLIEETQASAVVVTPPAKAARSGALTFKRGLYQVANLCYMFEELGWHVDLAKCEAATEGDGSKVPAMLAAVLHDLGEALITMTQEEVAEALAGCDIEPEEDEGDVVLVVEERQHIAASTSPAMRAFRRGLAHAKVRAGKKLSTETIRCLQGARDLHDEAMGLHRTAMRKHKDGVAAINDLLDQSGAPEAGSDSTQTVQTSSGADVDEGTEGQRMAADFRRRQVELRARS